MESLGHLSGEVNLGIVSTVVGTTAVAAATSEPFFVI